VSLTVADGEFVVFVGPSGCGKSTLLRIVCGLETPSAGVVRFDGRDMRGVPPAGRKLAMVFQSYALYPHMSVADNMGFALRMSRIPKSERAARVRKAAETLQITRLLERRPKELSGGQRQRVAIGRAIVREPSLFLFDEPLSNLDAELRVEMRFELAELHRRLKTTMIYVTHDQVEAMTLADRIVVLRDGVIEQVGSPIALYEKPTNRFVANFIGTPHMNFLAGRVIAARVTSAEFEVLSLNPATIVLPIKAGAVVEVGETVSIGVRPEELRFGGAGDAILQMRAEFIEYVGGAAHIHAPNNPAGRLIVRHPGAGAKIGETFALAIAKDACHVFSEQGERLSP